MASITYRALWRWHFHAGLFCIPFVIVLALTGSIYLFKPQIDAFADRNVDSLQVTGRRASGEAQITAALASLPGSKLFVYEIPREPDDAVRVHLYSPDGTGRIVYVHPESLAILKTVPHTHRLTEIVRTIHGELFAGRTGSILIELAASWAHRHADHGRLPVVAARESRRCRRALPTAARRDVASSGATCTPSPACGSRHSRCSC